MPAMTLDFTKEDHSGEFKEIGPGVWTLSSKYQPGGVSRFPEINNRVFAFKVTVSGQDQLLFFGMPGQFKNSFHPAKVSRELSQKLNMKIFGILGQGGLHMAFIHEWAEEFPEVDIFVPPTRVLRTAAGRKLIERFGKDRFTNLPANGWPELKGQLEFRLMDGLLVHVDVPTPNEGNKDTKLNMLKTISKIKPVDPHDEVFCFHPPSGLLIGGDNLTWHFKEGEKVPFMLKMAGCKCGSVGLNKQAIIADPVHRERVAEHWKAVMANDIRVYCGFHERPGQALEGPNVKSILLKGVAAQMDPSTASCLPF